jgi:hypothetical protein
MATRAVDNAVADPFVASLPSDQGVRREAVVPTTRWLAGTRCVPARYSSTLADPVADVERLADLYGPDGLIAVCDADLPRFRLGARAPFARAMARARPVIGRRRRYP